MSCNKMALDHKPDESKDQNKARKSLNFQQNFV